MTFNLKDLRIIQESKNKFIVQGESFSPMTNRKDWFDMEEFKTLKEAKNYISRLVSPKMEG